MVVSHGNFIIFKVKFKLYSENLHFGYAAAYKAVGLYQIRRILQPHAKIAVGRDTDVFIMLAFVIQTFDLFDRRRFKIVCVFRKAERQLCGKSHLSVKAV